MKNQGFDVTRRERRHMVSRVFGFGLTLVLLTALVLVPVEAQAQRACEVSLPSANALFEEGRFTAAKDAISDCLASGPRRAEKVQCYSMLTKIHLAFDNLLAAETTLSKLLSVNPDFTPDVFDSPRFNRLVNEAKMRSLTPTVTSVSKSKESLLEAPATVYVVTAEEIERRGYLDIEAILHDLAGFDFSRTYGAPYSTVYQRGYRSDDTTRTLLLVDGVEDNDLHSSIAYISRQFPLSNIERIEVVHGPASTMYGANAFAGVINIITKEPEQIIKEGETWGYDAWLTGGTWSTSSIDGTVAGQTRTGSMGWSLSVRRYESDETDLSGYSDWDYDPAVYDGVNYMGRGNLNPTDSGTLAGIFERYSAEDVDASPFFDVTWDADGNPVAISLTEEGDQRARAFDQAAMDLVVNGHPIGYTNPTEDWLVYAKLKTANNVLGLQLYSRSEGLNSQVTDLLTAGGANGSNWQAEHIFLYQKYTKRFVEDKLTFTIFNRYKKHDVDGSNSGFTVQRSYAMGMLGVTNLLDGLQSFYGTSYTSRSNNQLRSEMSLFYDHSEKFNIIGGLELRYSSIGAQNLSSSVPPAGETAEISPILGGNEITSRDIGAFAQASYRPIVNLKFVMGLRFDNNKIRDTGGYGTVFNPRLAVVYTWSDFVFKAIYAEAFQDAPVFQKYETSSLRMASNPTLSPEEVSNIELSAAWSPRENLSFQLALYQADYQGIVEERTVDCAPLGLDCDTTNQFQNAGSLDLKGVNATALWTPGIYRLSGNYTYSDPFNPDEGLRVGDIASHRINLLGEVALFNEKLDLSLRVNWVNGRETGAGTTVGGNPYTKIDDYTVAHVAVTYRELLPGIDLQLAVHNLFDTEYFDPGYRSSAGIPYPPRIPQPERAIFLSLRARR